MGRPKKKIPQINNLDDLINDTDVHEIIIRSNAEKKYIFLQNVIFPIVWFHHKIKMQIK